VEGLPQVGQNLHMIMATHGQTNSMAGREGGGRG
jgi:hypothetical protein